MKKNPKQQPTLSTAAKEVNEVDNVGSLTSLALFGDILWRRRKTRIHFFNHEF
jgi:hypothetical protein